jgi:lysophospholipase L1-like esterase
MRMLPNFFLLAVVSFLTLAFAEGLLRAVPGLLTEEAAVRMHWREMGFARDDDGETLVVDDADLGFRYLPNRTGNLRRGDLAFSFTTDEHGFRNASPWPERADIVVLGDSMAFSFGVGDDAAWTSLVQKALPETKLLNLSMIGSGPQQYLEVLQRHGLALEPTVVLFTLFPGNDLSDAAAFDDWRRSGTGRGLRQWRAVGDAEQPQRTLIDRVVEASYVLAVARDVRRNLASPLAGETVAIDDGSRLRLAPSAYAQEAELAQPDHPAFGLVMDMIAEARERVVAHGGRFVVLLMPTKEEVYLQLLGRSYPPLVDAFAAALDERGIEHLNLTIPLRDAARDGAALYFEVDGHPNERGYAVIADAVTALLSDADGAKATLDGPVRYSKRARPGHRWHRRHAAAPVVWRRLRKGKGSSRGRT